MNELKKTKLIFFLENKIKYSSDRNCQQKQVTAAEKNNVYLHKDAARDCETVKEDRDKERCLRLSGKPKQTPGAMSPKGLLQPESHKSRPSAVQFKASEH